jgi:cell shape-determining protein MreC
MADIEEPEHLEKAVETKEVFDEETKRLTEEPVEEPVVKEVKPKKRPMTAERKAQMLENLKKGREIAARNRQLKKEGKTPPPPKKAPKKKVEFKETNEDVQTELNSDLSNLTIINSLDALKKELAELKSMPKQERDDSEIKALRDEIQALKQQNKIQEIKKALPVEPVSAPVDIPKPQPAYSTYVPNIWSQFK